jgi:type I restriction enzyme S subunit
MSGNNGRVTNGRASLPPSQYSESGSLPLGWSVAKISDFTPSGGLFDGPFGSSLKTADYTDHGIRVIRLENVSNLRFVDDRAVYISQQKYQLLEKHTVGEGDLLVGSFVDGQVRVCLVPKLATLSIAKADCFCVRPDGRVIGNRYLMYLLGSEKTREAFIDHIHGATRPRITTKQLRQLTVQIPPLAEQQRIVAALDAVLAKVASCRERLARIPTLLKRFRQAILAAACSGRLTADWREKNSAIAHDWQTLPASEACELVQSGSTPPKGEFAASGIPFLKVYNIVDNRVDFDYRPQFVSEKMRSTKLRRSVVLPGDVLMNIVGPPLGKVAVVPKNYKEWNINQALVLFRPKPFLLNRYLYLALASGEPYAEILQETRGSAGQANISLSQCRAMLLSYPGVAEQQEIVRRVDALFAVADKLEARYELARRHVDRLAQAVLAKAFRGELVPTEHALAAAEGRDYETAEQLLERIRAARPAAPSKPRRPRAKKSRT